MAHLLSANIFNFLISKNRIPSDAKKREQWIKNIQNHQTFTLVDQNTMRFSVCNEHFEANKIRRLKGRVVVDGPPTIFPEIHKIACPSQRITSTAPSVLDTETTGKVPLVEPQSCLEQYRRLILVYLKHIFTSFGGKLKNIKLGVCLHCV